LFEDTQLRASKGEFALADSAGHIFRISGYQRVAPFGGAKRIGHFFLGSIFAAPVLESPKNPSLADFKAEVGNVVRKRFGKAFVERVLQAGSAGDVVRLVAERR
tara:strand:+ start:564 stop:875 length:312 start_codon:yes stop_codon:yes gene_type:complete